MQHMDLDGLNFEDYIDDAIDIYRSDFPEKAILFDDLAEQNIQIENNEIQRVGGRMSGLSPMDQYHVMKYLQLKYLTLYLQKDKFMGKFCFYGCWCFPRAAGAQWSGYGVPVDNIDKSCREFTTCYNCIFNQQLIGQRCDESNPVRYKKIPKIFSELKNSRKISRENSNKKFWGKASLRVFLFRFT